jgi:hypothetical protein
MWTVFLLFAAFALAQREEEDRESRNEDDQDKETEGPTHGRGEDLIPHSISVFEAKKRGENVGLRNDLYKRLSDDSPIKFHNGPIMSGHVVVYPIFYGDWNKSGRSEETGRPYSDTTEGAAILLNFLKLYGNETLSERFSINSNYASDTNFVKTVPKSFETASAYFIETLVLGNVISAKDVKSLVAFAINKNSISTNARGAWKKTSGPDPNGIYLLMTASEIEEHGGFCEDYCGWHTFGTIADANEIKYAFIGNPANCLEACSPQMTRSPNGNLGVDAMINVIAHELDEIVTDPLLNAWYDAHGEETADKCNWDWGTSVSLGNDGAYANLKLRDYETGAIERYLVQTQWKVDLGTSFVEQIGCSND